MKTILSCVNFFGTVASASINFYFLLSHDDLNKGVVEPIDLTSQMTDVSQLVPWRDLKRRLTNSLYSEAVLCQTLIDSVFLFMCNIVSATWILRANPDCHPLLGQWELHLLCVPATIGYLPCQIIVNKGVQDLRYHERRVQKHAKSADEDP